MATDERYRLRFFQAGAAFPYEDVSSYQKRPIRQRLTRRHLADYLQALGVPLEAVVRGEHLRRLASYRQARPVKP